MEQQRRIPKEEIVRTIIESAIEDRGIGSQSELTSFIKERLSHGDDRYRISGKRARLIALEIPELVVHIETRAGEVPDKCPSCSGKLDSIYMRNLKGDKILAKLACTVCPYEGRQNKWVPRRYAFTKRAQG